MKIKYNEKTYIGDVEAIELCEKKNIQPPNCNNEILQDDYFADEEMYTIGKNKKGFFIRSLFLIDN